jgi:hypothetical protein
VGEAAALAYSGLDALPIRQGFGNMQAINRVGSGEIGDAARNPKNAGSSPTGQPELTHRLLDQLCRIRSEQDGVGLNFSVAGRTVWPVAVK